ncbi:f-box domain-containing protein [Gigaspora margarita]|uniref:F-box domain-containing protein n=1 Tax=Gigaspora margarita TaxID=4874 RepID=A0A8H4AU41_GIGMA|nr:f-box domain-containing protein [Gigaspora margarita]
MITLPNECLFEIFNNFRDCYKSLFSCLLVNRQWCRVIVPILWSKPLDDFRDARIINIYLLALNVEEQVQLIPFKIMLPNDPNPLFDYTTYTTSIVDYHLCRGIGYWLNNERIRDTTYYYECEDVYLLDGKRNEFKHEDEEDEEDENYEYWLNGERDDIRDIIYYSEDYFSGHEDYKGYEYWYDDERRSIRKCENYENYENIIRTIKSSLISMLLRKSKNLKFVGFYGIVHNKILEKLVEILYKNAAIKTLNICIDNLGPKEGILLIETLHKNVTPYSLYIGDNQLGIDEGKPNLVKFNLTEHWLSVTYSKNKQYSGTELNLLYLTGSLPTSIETVTPKCKKIEITCESHDQGWSDYPESHGTYDSHTWGEVSIITTTHNYDDKFIIYNAVEKEPKIRYKVYTNKHADYSWQVHNYVFLSYHPLVQSLQPGDFVGLWIRSRYPGWCNYIKRAEIKLYYTV